MQWKLWIVLISAFYLVFFTIIFRHTRITLDSEERGGGISTKSVKASRSAIHVDDIDAKLEEIVRPPSPPRSLRQPASIVEVKNDSLPQPNYCLHAFYYMWYSNPEHDGRYSHWNHQYIPHWNPSLTKRFKTGMHVPPADIGASFYPKLGPYSSTSRQVMETHMQQFQTAGIGVAVVSWYPSGMADQEGAIPPDNLIPQLLEVAEGHGIKIALHIEPYQQRSPLSVRNDLKYIHLKYASHPAYFKMATQSNSMPRPMVYVYDSYLSDEKDWAKVLKDSGTLTIRGTSIDSLVIGLVVQMSHTKSISTGGFDGFYTYFASDGFTYGSSTRNWPYLSSFAKQANLVFIPSAGPGYDDSRVRPWNSINSRNRKKGVYYKKMMSKATSIRNAIVSITSFNEWHEGTQIEPAIPMKTGSYQYQSYSPLSPEHYLNLTAKIAKSFLCHLT